MKDIDLGEMTIGDKNKTWYRLVNEDLDNVLEAKEVSLTESEYKRVKEIVEDNLDWWATICCAVDIVLDERK